MEYLKSAYFWARRVRRMENNYSRFGMEIAIKIPMNAYVDAFLMIFDFAITS